MDRQKYLTYSAAALAFLAGNFIEAEVIYTDIDPDVTIDDPGTGVQIDLNGDGTNDFNIFFSSTNWFNITYFGGFNFYAINAIFGSPENDNAIAAFTGGGGAYAYPYVISSGIEIGPATGNFLNNSYQTLLYQFYAVVSSVFYYPIVQAGPWIFGQTDKFMGLELHDGDSTYYGWVRLSVAENNRSFTIKDLAIESISDTPIETFITPTEIAAENQLELTMYNYGNQLYISGIEPTELPLNIQVFDAMGRLVMNTSIFNSASVVTLPNLPKGNYIVLLSNKEKTHTSQIHL